MKTQYTHIDFVENLGGHWSCLNRRGRNELGRCAFYRPWKQWVFQPQPSTEFSADCLEDIAHFLRQLNGPIAQVKRAAGAL